MKKIVVFSSTVALSAILMFSAMSFRGDDPKQKKTECTTASKCEKNKDSADASKSENGACCDQKNAKASGACEKKGAETADKK